MSYLAVHRDEHLTLSTDDAVIPPPQVHAFDDALALADAMRILRDEQAGRLAAVRQAAHAKGYAEGLLQGRREAHAGAAEQLADTLAQLLVEHQDQRAAMRAAVLELSLLVVRRVAATMARDELLAALVAQAFDRLLADEGNGRGAAAFAVRLHPRMLLAVRQRFEANAPTHSPTSSPASSPTTAPINAAALALEWRADESLAVLDCVVETAAGRVLAGLEAQLERIRAVLGELPRESAAAGETTAPGGMTTPAARTLEGAAS
jgi:type III secretion protein L